MSEWSTFFSEQPYSDFPDERNVERARSRSLTFSEGQQEYGFLRLTLHDHVPDEALFLDEEQIRRLHDQLGRWLARRAARATR